jgi:hypothetical protein
MKNTSTKIRLLVRLSALIILLNCRFLPADAAGWENRKQDVTSQSNQDITVKGKVVSGGKEGLPGVTILVEGSSNGTTTDADGNYSIQAPSEGVIIFSYVGYVTQKIPVQNRSLIEVNLVADT